MPFKKVQNHVFPYSAINQWSPPRFSSSHFSFGVSIPAIMYWSQCIHYTMHLSTSDIKHLHLFWLGNCFASSFSSIAVSTFIVLPQTHAFTIRTFAFVLINFSKLPTTQLNVTFSKIHWKEACPSNTEFPILLFHNIHEYFQLFILFQIIWQTQAY